MQRLSKPFVVDEDLAAGETHRYVFVNRNGTAHRTEVEVGLSDDTYQEIKSGVKTATES